jgi:hypothetical protein
MSEPDEAVDEAAVSETAIRQHTGYDRDKLIRELSATLTFYGRPR